MNKMFLHARSKRGAQVSGRLARARSGASQNKDTNAMMQSIRTPLSKFAAIFDTDEFLRKFLMALAMARKGSEKVRVISMVAPFLPWREFSELAEVSSHQWRAARDYARSLSLYADESELTSQFDAAKKMFIGRAERGICGDPGEELRGVHTRAARCDDGSDTYNHIFHDFELQYARSAVSSSMRSTLLGNV
jgi:hypothetical protein